MQQAPLQLAGCQQQPAALLPASPPSPPPAPSPAQALLHMDYKYVDVRPELEIDEVGKFKGAVNVPFFNSKRVYDAAENKKVRSMAGSMAGCMTVRPKAVSARCSRSNW
jgi:hypothetical protein